MKLLQIFLVGMSLVCGASQGALASSKVNPDGTLFICDEGTPYVQVLVPHDMSLNAILMLESEQMEMAPLPVESGFGADLILGPHHWMVQGKGPTELTLYKDDDQPKQCKIADMGNAVEIDQPEENEQLVSAMGNFSLGGNVRSGPGTQHATTDSLAYGEPVVLIERSGVVLDSYEWFNIEYGEGVTGYQWGGIMCSNALHITGLYDPCPADLN